MFATWFPWINSSKFNFFNIQDNKNGTDSSKDPSTYHDGFEKQYELNEALGPTNDSTVISKKIPLRNVCRMLEPAIVVHGGAGIIPDELVDVKLKCVKKAATAGFQVLKTGGTCVQAVEAAIRVMEDDPVMNAGRGSVLNFDGEVETDACIMVGNTLDTGGVASVKDIANPISLAKLVMEKTPHTLLCGEGARRFALKNEFPIEDQGALVTPAAEKALEVFKANPEGDLHLEVGDIKTNLAEDKIWPRTESVGVVAYDKEGKIAVGASSGGWNGRNKGKISEACTVGSGIYADDKLGGVSLAGIGKYMNRLMVAYQITKEMEVKSPLSSNKYWVNTMNDKFLEKGGAVGISKFGQIGVFFNSERMPWAYQKKNVLHYGVNPKEDETEIVT